MKLLSLLSAICIAGPALFAATPASDATQPESEKTELAAREVVNRYYEEIDHGHYNAAYQLWDGDGVASGKSLQEFTASFANTEHTSVTTGTPTDSEGAMGSVYVTIPVQVIVLLKDGLRQQYSGKYVMRRCNDVPGCTLDQRRWHIKSVSLRVAKLKAQQGAAANP